MLIHYTSMRLIAKIIILTKAFHLQYTVQTERQFPSIIFHRLAIIFNQNVQFKQDKQY